MERQCSRMSRGMTRNQGVTVSQPSCFSRRLPKPSLLRITYTLDFDAIFYLDGGVPAQNEVTSLTAIGPAAREREGVAAFTTTHWSVVLEARGQSAVAEAALEKLCRTYWWPLY